MNERPPSPAAPDGSPPPRLGVIHLLAWLTVAAVLFGTERSVQILENAAKHTQELGTHYFGLELVRLTAMAAGVVGLVTLIRWRSAGRSRPLAPGHWILAIESIAMLLVYGVEIAWRTAAAALGLSAAGMNYLPVVAIFALIAVVQMLAFAFAAARCAEKGPWRLVLRLLSVACTSQATLDAILFLVIAGWLWPIFPMPELFYVAPAVVHGVASVTTVAYAAYDAYRIHRDWLHGLGVGLVLVNGLVWIGYAWRFIR